MNQEVDAMSAQDKSWVVVDAAVLPEVIMKTLTVKRMLANREEKSSSAACRAVGISRSAFYKYRDSVFVYEEQMREQIFTVYLLLHDESGVLSGVLHTLTDARANVLTLNQSMPVDGAATVTVTFRLPGWTALRPSQSPSGCRIPLMFPRFAPRSARKRVLSRCGCSPAPDAGVLQI